MSTMGLLQAGPIDGRPYGMFGPGGANINRGPRGTAFPTAQQPAHPAVSVTPGLPSTPLPTQPARSLPGAITTPLAQPPAGYSNAVSAQAPTAQLPGWAQAFTPGAQLLGDPGPMASTGALQAMTPAQIAAMQQQYPGFNVVPNWNSPNPWGTAPNGQAYQPGINGQGPTTQAPSSAPSQNGGSGIYGVNGATTPGMPSIANVNAPNMQDATQAYTQAVQSSFQPYFDQQQQGLKAQLAAQGILRSGAGNQGLQDLTAQQNAQVSGAVAPLIQQGFGQQFQAATGNAGAYNSALMQMVNNQLQAQLANQQMGMQGQEFNANLVNNAIMANTGYANNALNEGAAFGNNDYLNALNAQAGFLGSNLGALGYILGQGASGGLSAYLTGQQTGSQYANQQGQASGYTAGSNPYGSYMPFSPQGVGSIFGPGGAPQTPTTVTNPSVDPNAPPDQSYMPPSLGTYDVSGSGSGG